MTPFRKEDIQQRFAQKNCAEESVTLSLGDGNDKAMSPEKT